MQFFSLAILSATGIAVALAQQPPKVVSSAERALKSMNASEVRFVQQSLDSGRREANIAQLALRQGSSPQVKSFAQEMVYDQNGTTQRLLQIAREYAIPINDYVPSPSSPAYKSSQERTSMNWSGVDPKTNTGFGRTSDRLATLSGTSFDRAFEQQTVQDHETDISRYEAAQKTVTNADLKEFIDSTLPTRREHLAEARALK